MPLKVVCSGYSIRYPLGGHVCHDFQYLAGFQDLGCETYYAEDYGWSNSCYNPDTDSISSDPAMGCSRLGEVFAGSGLKTRWCYLDEEGESWGMSRDEFAQVCRDADLCCEIAYINSIPELKLCNRSVLVDTDPVFTQIGAHGLGRPLSEYDALFTYGENIHKPGCTIPVDGHRWHPTRQPVVDSFWPGGRPEGSGPITTVMNWSAYGDARHDGRVYGQKDREFEAYFELPRWTGAPFEIAVQAPSEVMTRMRAAGWHVASGLDKTRTVSNFREYLDGSRAEFSVVKHGYVTTRSGWFSNRTTSYLPSGRPVVVQDTGFSDFLPCGEGLLAFSSPEQAIEAVRCLAADPIRHCRAARDIVREYFDSKSVLSQILEVTL